MYTNKALRYGMFGSLYFTQGTILSYFTALNALYFLSRGLSMTDVGIFASIALIPFVIKIFLGVLSDKVNLFGLGHRKPYILLGLLVQTVCLILVSFVDPAENYWGFVALAFTLQMGMALYDTCTDGLALDTTPPEEEGTIQGFMVGGRALAVVVTASVVGLLAEHVSWAAVFWVLAAITLVPIPLVLGIKEEQRVEGEDFDWSAFGAFKQKTVIFLALLGFLFFFIIQGANPLVNAFLQTDFGISLSMAGYFTTVWGVGVVLGGAFGGRIYSRIGMKNATMLAMGVGLVGILLLAFISSPAMAWPLVALYGLAYGTQQTVFFSLAMKYTEKRIAASMFSILMAVTNVAQGAGMAISGISADAAGFRWTFAVLALLNLLALPLLPVIFGKRNPTES
ncbi:MAG: MFS transporter [Anaerolineales bacterium]|nr:MFS transporter [Chloroflexota bacterium]MBL6980864.1 MFS transporter [Anaerolineales bacterium]